MSRLCLSLLVLAAWLSNLQAQELKDLPKGPQPDLVTAVMDKDGKVVISQIAVEYITVKEARTVVVDGKNVTVEVAVVKSVSKPLRFTYEVKDVKFYGSDGKELDAKKAAAALEKPVGVLLARDGQPVDPVYLRMFKEGTVSLVVDPSIQRRYEAPPKEKP